MQVRKISDACGVEVEGIDLARRSPQDDRMLKELYDEHGLVVFREQKLTKQQLVDAGAPFAKRHRSVNRRFRYCAREASGWP